VRERNQDTPNARISAVPVRSAETAAVSMKKIRRHLRPHHLRTTIHPGVRIRLEEITTRREETIIRQVAITTRLEAI
jgi:hypothetical protein